MHSEGNVLKNGHEKTGIFCTSFVGGQRYLAKHSVTVLEHPQWKGQRFASARKVAETNNQSTHRVIENAAQRNCFEGNVGNSCKVTYSVQQTNCGNFLS
jgi:hypothetical protein